MKRSRGIRAAVSGRRPAEFLRLAILAVLLCPLVLTTAVLPALAAQKELVVYSGRKEPLIKPVLEMFEKESGIKVVLHSGGASELANAILEEGGKPRGDVFIANDAGTLEMLRLKGALMPNTSARVRSVPEDLRASDGSWVGVSGRARVIMYNTQLVSKSELPKSVMDLVDPKWRGQVAVASSQNESWIAQISAMRVVLGERATEKFLRDLVRNQVKVLPGHTQVRNAVGKGEFKLGLVNHYYYHLEKQDGSPVGVVYPDQGAKDMGALVNIAGVGIIRGARNESAARQLVDFLLSPGAQALFAKLNFEIPTLPGAQVYEARPLEEIKRMKVNLERLGKELDATLDLIEKVGLP